MVEDTWKRAALLGRWEHSTAILWSQHQAFTTCDAPKRTITPLLWLPGTCALCSTTLRQPGALGAHTEALLSCYPSML